MTRNNTNKQHRYTLGEKISVLDRLEQGDKQTEVEMDTGIPVKTQQRWTKQRKILQAQNRGTTQEETYEIVEIDGGERHGFIRDTPEINIKVQSSTSNSKVGHDIKDTKDMVDTSATKGIKVMLVDEDTKEVLLTTDAMIFSSPNETIFEGEVEVELKRPKIKQPTTTKPETNMVEAVDNPNSTVEQVKDVLSNDWIKILLPVGIGVAGWLMKKRTNGDKDNDTSW